MSERLAELRKLIFEGIEYALQTDDHHKSYEGEMSVHYPHYFEEMDGNGFYEIELSCYVLGPSRHYRWRGKTLDEAVDRAMTSVTEWVQDAKEDFEETQRYQRMMTELKENPPEWKESDDGKWIVGLID